MERGSWLRHAMGVTTPVVPYAPRFEKEAVIWCAALLGVEVNRLEEILNNVSGHYQEFWMRKRSRGYRMISAPDKDLQAIQSTIYSRIFIIGDDSSSGSRRFSLRSVCGGQCCSSFG